MTTFSDLTFVFRFLPLFLLIYYIVHPKLRNAVLFIGSILFYASSNPVYAGLLLAVVFLNWLFSDPIFTEKSKVFLAFALILDLSLLGGFKLLSQYYPGRIAFPLGLSFYVFKMLAFQADVYLGKIPEKPRFFQTAAYFTMFPQLPEGPIMRFSEGGFEKERRISLSQVEQGLCLFAAGLSMKVLLADRFALLWNEVYRIGFESISTPMAWCACAICTFRLYFDFWGYSLMAGALGVLLGFPFIRNFNHPYAARGVSDFYRRWHITLGTFFRDYLYIPMGGSRKGGFRTAGNLFVVWLITAAWHGITWNFFLWGGVLFLLILWEKLVLSRVPKLLAVLGRVHVIVLIPLTWLIFSVTEPNDLLFLFGRLFPFFSIGSTVSPGDYRDLLTGAAWLFPVAVTLCVPVIFDFVEKHLHKLYVKLPLFGLFWVSVYYVVISGSNPFLYFNF